MRDVRDILEQGVRGFDPGDGFDETRRRVRRRQTTRRLVAAGTSLAVAAAGGVFAWRTFADRGEIQPRPAASPSVSDEGPSGSACDPSALKPSFVPGGFDPEPRKGPGGGIAPDAWPGDAVHYQGPNPGAHVTVTLLASLDAVREPHAEGRAMDLGLGSGTIGSIEDGYSVEARWEEARGACSFVWITAYGVSESELRRFGEGLRDTGP